jgi:methyl-accepting chemotaxis protein
MHFFKDMPMKYRLFIIVFLPAIFLIWSAWMDYRAIQNEVKVQGVMEWAQKIDALADDMEAISSLSKIHLISKDTTIDKELVVYRNFVDTDLNEIKEYLTKVYASNDLVFKEKLQSLFNKTDSIHQINLQVDNRTIGYKDLDAFYDGIINSIFNIQDVLLNVVSDVTSAKGLYMLITLMKETLANGVERSILMQALTEDRIDTEAYEALLESIGAQKAYKSMFFIIASSQEEKIYDATVQGDVIENAEKIRSIVLEKGTAGNFGITPKEWWQQQTNKIKLLHDAQTKILNFNVGNLSNLVHEHRLDFLFRIIIIFITLLVSFLLIFINLRSLARKLQEEINVLSTSGEEIGRSITETASGTSETAAAVSETTTTVEELKQTAQVSTDKAKNVADVSEDALETLKKSEVSVEAAIQGMNSIKDGMELISDCIVKLSEHSQMIRDIIDTVNDLAEQSHILAVNAAIESAKAGDQGKGFAVVAQEVRSLAEQSKQATARVRNILNDIQNATSSAVMATEKGSKAVANGLTQSMETNESIKFLSLEINKVAQAASQISLSSQQQLVGVDQLTIAMSNIKTASNQQVGNMNQIEKGMLGMNAVSQSLKQVIKDCKI